MEGSITNLRRRPFQLEDTAEVTSMTDETRGRGPAFRTVAIGSLIAGGLFVAGIVGPLMASMALRTRPQPRSFRGTRRQRPSAETHGLRAAADR